MTAPNFLQEPALDQLPRDQLMARVARAQMYFVELAAQNRSGASTPHEVERDHLEFLYRLEAQGSLFGAGPVDDRRNPETILAIVAAASSEQAKAMFEQDPLVKAGLHTVTVRSYTINEGVACYVARAMSLRSRTLGEISSAPGLADMSLASLQSRAAGVQVFLVPLEPTDKSRPPEDVTTMDSHFVWLRENEMSAKLVACGPIESMQPLAPGVWGGGLGIFATSRTEAEHAAQLEPSGLAGYRSLSVSAWTLDYGLVAPIAKVMSQINNPQG